MQQLIAGEDYRRYYMHSTSHWLGLDVHDAGSYRVDIARSSVDTVASVEIELEQPLGPLAGEDSLP